MKLQGFWLDNPVYIHGSRTLRGFVSLASQSEHARGLPDTRIPGEIRLESVHVEPPCFFRRGAGGETQSSEFAILCVVTHLLGGPFSAMHRIHSSGQRHIDADSQMLTT